MQSEKVGMFTKTEQAPQWLLASWIRSCVAAGATANEGELVSSCRALLDCWSGPERIYHGPKHLVDVLMHVDELAEEAHAPDLVRLAAWFHGSGFSAQARSAYANKAGEDEVASGARARLQLMDLGVSADTAERVSNLVTNLVRHQLVRSDLDSAVLNDADLAILKSDPQHYKEYLRAIREEYAHIPTIDFVRTRLHITAKLLARPQLFTTVGAAGWEDPARENLTAERARLTIELGKLKAAQVTHN